MIAATETPTGRGILDPLLSLLARIESASTLAVHTDAASKLTVELRVHGVGGTPPHDLLGEASPSDIVRVGGHGKSAFYARVRDPACKKGGRDVEGYAWGPLTSSGLLQPLWILLLPFSLLNVSGWMLPAPDRSRGSGFGWALARVVVFLLGLCLTADYV